MNKIYVVTAVHNSISHTKRFLKCLKLQTYKEIEIVIIDDNSTDGTESYASKYYPNIVVLHGDGNLWWTEGLNTAIREVLKKADFNDYILTINNDCTFEKNYIKNILRTIKKFPTKSIIASLERDQFSNEVITGYLTEDWGAGFINNDKSISGIKSVSLATTKGTLYPMGVFKDVGMFNSKKFPHYVSDIEFAFRCRKKGYEIYLDPTCEVFCDSNRTGLNHSNIKSHDLSTVYSLLFSRKSAVNIVDHYNMIQTIVPKKYRAKNYFRLGLKVFYILSLIFRKV